jgi:CheY-like chemotaxis protein
MTRVLIVEDEKSLAEAYRAILEKHGYQADIALDGQAALDTVAKEQPDLILLDMKMPKMNGLEFLRHLDKEKAANTKVIIFSNQDIQADIDEAFRLGAKRYLLKYWAAPQDLVKVVEEGLNS